MKLEALSPRTYSKFAVTFVACGRTGEIIYKMVKALALLIMDPDARWWRTEVFLSLLQSALRCLTQPQRVFLELYQV